MASAQQSQGTQAAGCPHGPPTIDCPSALAPWGSCPCYVACPALRAHSVPLYKSQRDIASNVLVRDSIADTRSHTKLPSGCLARCCVGCCLRRGLLLLVHAPHRYQAQLAQVLGRHQVTAAAAARARARARAHARAATQGSQAGFGSSGAAGINSYKDSCTGIGEAGVWAALRCSRDASHTASGLL